MSRNTNGSSSRADESVHGIFTQREVVDIIRELQIKQQQLRKQNEKLRHAQKALRKSHEKFIELYDLAPIGYMSIKKTGRIAQGNHFAAVLLGVAKHVLTKNYLSSFVISDDKPKYRKFIANLAQANDVCRAELRMTRHDGSRFYALLESRPAFCQETFTGEYKILLSDITERKRIEDELKNEKERIQVTLESIGDAVITTNKSLTIDYINPLAEHLTGYLRQYAIGKPLDQIFRIFDEHTGKRLPLSECLQKKQVMTLEQNITLKSASGEDYGVQYTASPIQRADSEVLGIVLVFSNISDMRKQTRKIAYQATHDPLTGLVNRREFEKRLERSLINCKEHGTNHTLCFMDLDRFKAVNDSVGHNAGDNLLRTLTGILASKIRGRDTLARVGGDEFSLLLDNCPIDKARKIAQGLVAAVKDFTFEWENRKFNIGISIGLVSLSADINSMSELISQADRACYSAKRMGRGRVCVYENEQETDNSHTKVKRIGELSSLLEKNHIVLYGQEIVQVCTSNSRADSNQVELVLRILDNDKKISLAKDFIRSVERNGLMSVVDRWVIKTTLKSYRKIFDYEKNITVSINLSENSIFDDGLINFVQAQIVQEKVRAASICFEFSEMTVVSNLDRMKHVLLALKALGCQISIDNFGSGLSSFAYLKNLPIDYLKIDGSFIRDMDKNLIDHAIVAAIIKAGRVMGIKTIACCIESLEIYDYLKKLKVDYGQGYAISRPKPLQDFLLKKSNAKSKISKISTRSIYF